MSTPSHPSTPMWAHAPPPAFRWRHWSAGQARLAALLVTSALAAVFLLVRWASGQWHLACLAAAVLLATLWRFYLPVQYELDEEGVHHFVLGTHRTVPWDAIRRYEVTPAGILFLPDDGHCPLDALRGLFLPWGPHRDEVLHRVRYYLNRVTIS